MFPIFAAVNAWFVTFVRPTGGWPVSGTRTRIPTRRRRRKSGSKRSLRPTRSSPIPPNAAPTITWAPPDGITMGAITTTITTTVTGGHDRISLARPSIRASTLSRRPPLSLAPRGPGPGGRDSGPLRLARNSPSMPLVASGINTFLVN